MIVTSLANLSVVSGLQLMAKNARYAQFLFQLADLGCSLQISKLWECARALLKLMPAGE